MRITTIGTLLILVVAATVTAQTKQVQSSQNTPESCRAFVQSFYDWYVPLTLKGSNVAAWDLALKSGHYAFVPELSRLLKRDSEAQAKVPDEIVGLDFDPFLASQDFSPKFAVQRVTRNGNSCLVEVYGVLNGQKAEHVVPEVRFTDGHWQFANFHYVDDGKPYDLVGLLKRLEAERKSQPQRR